MVQYKLTAFKYLMFKQKQNCLKMEFTFTQY